MRKPIILNTIERKYFYISRTIRCCITLIYPLIAVLSPMRVRVFLLPAWIIVFLGAEYFQELYLRRIITRPIVSITNTAKEIADLNLDVRCTFTSNDELGILSASLNELATNLQKALDDLKNANEQLQEDARHERVLLNQRKELVDSLSHEMKTPLGLIAAYTAGLKFETEEEKRSQYITEILTATGRMNTLIVSLLDLSSLEEGASILSNECFDFIELAETVGGRLLLDMPEKNYHFTYELPEEKIFIFADKHRIEQVLENLIGNAKRYVCDGGEIHLMVEHEQGRLLFSVFNQGRQIPTKDIPKIWTKFFKCDAKKRNSSGLGLAIVSQILSIYEVPYGVRNKPNGVEFFFYFPTTE